MDKDNAITIKISATTYEKILAIKKAAKFPTTIRGVVDYAIKKLRTTKG